MKRFEADVLRHTTLLPPAVRPSLTVNFCLLIILNQKDKHYNIQYKPINFYTLRKTQKDFKKVTLKGIDIFK